MKIYNKVCPICGVAFQTPYHTGVYCSHECYLEARQRAINDNHWRLSGNEPDLLIKDILAIMQKLNISYYEYTKNREHYIDMYYEE